MIIIPSYCAVSYAYNDRVERLVGDYLAKITGLKATNFSTGVARPEFDFELGDERGTVQIELKTTSSIYIPVETHKDEKQTIEAGLLTSTAPLVVTLSVGRRNHFGDIGKLRVWKRSNLLRFGPKNGIKRFHAGTTESQGSVTYSLNPSKDHVHTYLGDVPIVYQFNGTGDGSKILGYDLDSIFDDNKINALELLELINKYRGIE